MYKLAEMEKIIFTHNERVRLTNQVLVNLHVELFLYNGPLLKADGKYTVKFTEKVPSLIVEKELISQKGRIWFHSRIVVGEYSVWLKTTLGFWENGQNGNIYSEHEQYICAIKNGELSLGTLEEILSYGAKPTTAKKQMALLEKYQKMKDAIREIKKDIINPLQINL